MDTLEEIPHFSDPAASKGEKIPCYCCDAVIKFQIIQEASSSSSSSYSAYCCSPHPLRQHTITLLTQTQHTYLTADRADVCLRRMKIKEIKGEQKGRRQKKSLVWIQGWDIGEHIKQGWLFSKQFLYPTIQPTNVMFVSVFILFNSLPNLFCYVAKHAPYKTQTLEHLAIT